MAAPVPVLRGDVTLVGANLMDVWKKVRSDTETPDEPLRARFLADVPLQDHSGDELAGHIKKLTGEEPDLLYSMTGRDPKSQATAIRLAHFLILAANASAATSQKLSTSSGGKSAALSVANLLEGKDDPATKNPSPAASTSSEPASPKPPPAKKAKKTDKQPPPPEDESDSDDDTLEDDAIQKEIINIKEIGLDPLIHRYPQKLHGALLTLVGVARKTKAKPAMIARYQSIADFCLQHSSKEGIGEEIRRMIMTPMEKRFMEEANKAAAALEGHPHGRNTRAPPNAWNPPMGPPQHHQPWNQSRARGGWRASRQPPTRRAGAHTRCFNCGKTGHFQADCFAPPRKDKINPSFDPFRAVVRSWEDTTWILVHLGAGLNSKEGFFFFPDDKRHKFAVLREEILDDPVITLRTLQKFVGKCVSMALMVPGAQIYTRRCSKLMGEMTKKGQLKAKLPKSVRAEIEHWRFVDKDMKPVTWRDERHTSITIASDASGYKWGAVLHSTENGGSDIQLGDYWSDQDITKDINCKEAKAVALTLLSAKKWIENSRVQLKVDNKAQLQVEFGGKEGHSVDLMALDSNAQRDRSGTPLRHYTPYPTPQSAGVDMFRHNPTLSPEGKRENAYVFPPINMTGAVIQFLLQYKATVTVVVPKLCPRPLWWPILAGAAKTSIKIAEAGSRSALLFPSKQGLRPVLKPSSPCALLQPLPLIPRQWTPSVACPECHHPNDHNFRRCQMCGYVRKPFPPPRKNINVDEEKIQARLDEIHKLAVNTDYGKKKVALENELTDFLGNISPPKDLTTASPKDICSFLVWKDKGGKTVVHHKNCKNFGKKRLAECGCPQRLAAGTVDSVIGQLRSIFDKSGRGGDWNEAICTGNPAAAPRVREYLRVTKAEQANALIQPKQAQPVFHYKLEAVCKHIAAKMRDPGVKESTLFALARDQAFFKTLFFAADRAADLGRCKAEELAWLPDNRGFLFNHTFGKTLRDGAANTFPVLVSENTAICPVRGLQAYITMAKALHINISKGYLFRAINKTKEVINEPFSYDAAQYRFKSYLREIDQYDGDTLHGLRTASAITMAMGGADQASLMAHVGWKDKATAQRYMQLKKVCHEGSPAAILRDQVARRSKGEDQEGRSADAAMSYQRNNSRDLKPVF
ncbi:PREDICTED: uncharacterized protein LOC109466909 [Branchiostoma belcheri]|uniref:Uncharacterized protein LOC109466909 n=1 Tax=Branchiostoma belcheri TaxID=7741 RepID=A0A6P4YE02_BRABE|nr:PREDICTED: uncharacterized protein LOC109466909 [Branchiostoma belcheri]